MADPRGLLIVAAAGKEYRLWLGMSVLADMQAKHGQDVFSRLDAPAGAPAGWVPDLGILVDLFLFGLQRYHPEADRYTVDEILAENADAFPRLMAAAFPQPEGDKGNRKARRAA